MKRKFTILLDDETKRAARHLALRYECSTSEAIRRAILHHRETVFGVSSKKRGERKLDLARLFELFEGHDADEEIRRLKESDETT